MEVPRDAPRLRRTRSRSPPRFAPRRARATPTSSRSSATSRRATPWYPPSDEAQNNSSDGESTAVDDGSSGAVFGGLRYQASSPDEEALVTGAALLGRRLLSNAAGEITCETHPPDGSTDHLVTGGRGNGGTGLMSGSNDARSSRSTSSRPRVSVCPSWSATFTPACARCC